MHLTKQPRIELESRWKSKERILTEEWPIKYNKRSIHEWSLFSAVVTIERLGQKTRYEKVRLQKANELCEAELFVEEVGESGFAVFDL